MKALVRLERKVAQMLEENARRQMKRRSVKRALQRFAQLHPRWYESTFDEWFLARLPTGVLEAGDPAALAREWTGQFRYRDARRRELDIRELTPIAESFLTLLAKAEAELDRRLPGIQAPGLGSEAAESRSTTRSAASTLNSSR